MEAIRKIMKSLNVIYLALILGQLGFMAAVIFISTGAELDTGNMNLLRTFIPVVSVSTVAISYVIYNCLSKIFTW